MGKTKKLSLEERGEYLELCNSYWVSGCSMSNLEIKDNTDMYDVFVKRGLISDNGIDWLNEQFEEASKKSNQAKEAAKKRWDKNNADAMRTHSDSNASVMQRREEEKRVERVERKERVEKIERNNADAVVVLPYDSQVFKEAWQQWKDYKRTQHRFTYKSPASEQAALKHLTEITSNELGAVAAIHQSMAQGWKGIFAVDNKAKATTSEKSDEVKQWLNSYQK